MNKNLYKWQWGFLEKEQRYHQDLLRFTGVELLAILLTTMIQIYSVKSLFDNNHII